MDGLSGILDTLSFGTRIGDQAVLPSRTEYAMQGADILFGSPFADHLVSGFDRVIHVGREKSETAGALVAVMRQELRGDAPGRALVLGDVMRLYFVLVLRHGLDDGERGRCSSLVKLLSDTSLAPALEKIHLRPDTKWTVESLARAVGMSRAVFARRFTEVSGLTPIAYLTKWRISRAADLLSEGRYSLEEIAERVGYSSEAALSIAFNREMGLFPGAYRRNTRAHRTRSVAQLVVNAWRMVQRNAPLEMSCVLPFVGTAPEGSVSVSCGFGRHTYPSFL